MGSLANKDNMIRNYCSSGDIIFDVDPDDALIGSQVFKLISYLYETSGFWIIYSNNLKSNKLVKGSSKQIPPFVLFNNIYRSTFDFWATTHLKTYLRDLYMKIPV